VNINNTTPAQPSHGNNKTNSSSSADSKTPQTTHTSNTANASITSTTSTNIFSTATTHPRHLNKDCKYLVFPAHFSMFEELNVSKTMWSDHMPICYDLTSKGVFSIPYDFLRMRR
jgi:hypothetical protein